jgi:hypothetical protein
MANLQWFYTMFSGVLFGQVGIAILDAERWRVLLVAVEFAMIVSGWFLVVRDSRRAQSFLDNHPETSADLRR